MFAETINDRKIGVLSDTHGSCCAWRKALSLFGPGVKTVLHAGDVLYHGPRNAIPGGYTPADLADDINVFHKHGGRVIIAQGNCDAAVDAMVLEPEMQSCVSLLWNGDNFPLLRAMALRSDVDLAISGHTHICSLSREERTIFLNPGSTTIPKGREAGSAAVIDYEGIRIMTLEGDELHFEKW